MNARAFIDGLKANHPNNLPTEQAEKDMLRVLFRLGFAPEQLQRLYDETLRICNFFPKIYDLDVAISNLSLVSPKSDATGRTKQQIQQWDREEKDCITLQQWLHECGGMEEIRRECDGDEHKIAKRLQYMGMAVNAAAEKHREISDYDDSMFSETLDDL